MSNVNSVRTIGQPTWGKLLSPARWNNAVLTVGMVLLALAGVLVYGFSLQLPLFLDDMIHFRWLAWHNLGAIWRTARLLGYYRPLPFTIWKILALLQGRYDAPTLHALNLALHILNAFMVLGLAAGRSRRHGIRFGLSAALLFLLYPFSYQAVPWVGSLTHPLVTAIILGSLLLNRAARQRHSRSLLAASIGLALAAPFAHETGVLVAPLLALLLLTDEAPCSCREALRQTIPYWLCAAFGLAIWLIVPKEVEQTGLLDPVSLWQNGIYFAQGLAFPAAPLATRLVARFGLQDLQAIALVTLPAILAWSLLLWKAGRGRLLALALGWFILTLLPAWVMLGFWYIIDGPRLLYEASVGAALFWALPMDLCWPDRRRQAVGTVLAGLVVVAAAFGGYRFIRDRVQLYKQMRLAVSQLVKIQEDSTGRLLCVNYLEWLAPLSPEYAVGHEGVTLVPAYTGVTDLLWLHTAEERPVTSVVLPDILRHWRYHYSCIGSGETSDSIQAKLRSVEKVIVASYEGEDIAIHDAGGLEAEGRQPATDFLAAFDGQLGLLSASPERAGSELRVMLRWQCWTRPAQEITVFMHLYDETGKLVAQADGYPLMGTSRPLFWQPGDVWRDARMLHLPQALAPGNYTLKTGLYPTDGSPRLTATAPGGQRFQDDAVPLATLRIP